MKIKNFTLEGEALTVLARLDYGANQPVYDVMLTRPEETYGLSPEEAQRYADTIRSDLNALEDNYLIGLMREKFLKDWKEAKTDEQDDRQEGSAESREDA